MRPVRRTPAQDHHRENRDRRGVRESGDAVARGDAGPRTEYHQANHDPDGGDVDGHRLGNEQHERGSDNQKDEQSPVVSMAIACPQSFQRPRNIFSPVAVTVTEP